MKVAGDAEIADVITVPVAQINSGEDVLVGWAGDDVLNGGNDQNIYLPGAGADTMNDGSVLDIVFFKSDRSNYGKNGCSKKVALLHRPKSQKKPCRMWSF